MENIILSITNFGFILPCINYFNNQQYLQSIFIGLSGCSSIIYHMIECKKHNMPGIRYFRSNFYHNLFINIDRFFAVGSVIVCYIPKVFNYPYLILIGLLSIFISEILSRFIKSKNILSEKNIHVISHSIWHIVVFELVRLLSINYT